MLLITSLMTPFASGSAFAQDADPVVEPSAASEEIVTVPQDPSPIIEPSVADETVAIPVDTDGDGVEDALDVCPGGNDLVDTDGDATPDGCDTTPNGDTDGDGIDNLSDSTPNGDTDGDGVDNAADACPAGDDRIDADGDGTADACDDTPNGDVTEPVIDETASVAVEVAAEEQVVASAPVSCAVAEGAAPSIMSDLADYPPGALVTLTGAGWVAGQKVEIFVDDDGVADAEMGPWSHAATVTTDGSGNLFYQFNLANWFVANYMVVATGECSGATTAFTDGNIDVRVSGVSSATITYEVFKKSGCLPEDRKTSGTWPATSTFSTAAATSPSESIRLTAPAITGYTVSWSAGGTDVICTNGSSSSQQFTATYVASQANQTITFGALVNKTFGDAAFTVSATASSGLPVSFAATGTCSISGSTVTITGAGSCTVTASQAGNGNYTAAPNVSQDVTIAKATATLTLTTADLSQVYTGTGRTVGVTTTPADLTGVIVTYAGLITAPSAAGTYAVNATLTHDNYAAPAVSGTLTITKASQTITFGALANKTFGAAPYTVSATASSGLPVSFAATGNCTISGSAVTITGAGSCTVTASQAGNSNYSAAPSVERSFTIAKAAATLTLSNLAYTYDGIAHSATATTSPAGLTGVIITYDGLERRS